MTVMAVWFRSNGERKIQQAKLHALWESRQKRFRILVCVDGSDASYEGIRFASHISTRNDCDVILLYVRPIDQGLRTGGLQVRVARENMLQWGLELPGIQYLKRGLEMLVSDEEMAEDWNVVSTHTDVWGDPVGDNKVEYQHESGKSIVLKLKTAPDPASGILDQYELGPYNLMIMGAPSRWRGEFRSFWDAGVVQKAAMLAPCSVLVARKNNQGKGHIICTDGSEHSMDSMCRDAVLAHHIGTSVTIMTVASRENERAQAEKTLEKATAILEKIEIKITDAQIAVGNPTEEIIKIGNDYSVIAVSDSGKNWLKRLTKGSVAFGVMRTAETSVLNIR